MHFDVLVLSPCNIPSHSILAIVVLLAVQVVQRFHHAGSTQHDGRAMECRRWLPAREQASCVEPDVCAGYCWRAILYVLQPGQWCLLSGVHNTTGMSMHPSSPETPQTSQTNLLCSVANPSPRRFCASWGFLLRTRVTPPPKST